MMKPPVARSERGQSAVIVALLLVVLVGMLALVLDGGNAFWQRREAQNAADAGALAGARTWCNTQNATSAAASAQDYAVNRNGNGGAMQADVVVSGGLVTVSTSITIQTSFGAVLGTPQIVAVGIASAGCFLPDAGTGVLPFAWSCPVVVVNGVQQCAIVYNHVMVVMDSEKTGTQFVCQDPPGSNQPPGWNMNCDPDNDGINEYISGGNRSWLDLGGSGGSASQLVNWFNNGFPGTINTHTWFGGVTGTDISVFTAVADKVGSTLVIPVFTRYCNLAGLPQNVCPSQWDNNDTPSGDNIVVSPGTSTLYFYVETFSLFHITCVDAGPSKVVAEPGVSLAAGGHKCPVEYELEQAGLLANQGNKTKTIEGYFLQGTAPGLTGKGGGVGGGAYSIYLTQ
jgi:Putative Flp pilus-assembly TadE/G-like